MTDRDDREDWRRRHSLLAFGQALAEDDARRRLSAANQPEPSWRDDAVARHREARLRREAEDAPRPASAGERWDAPSAPADEDDDEASGLMRILPRRLRLKRAMPMAEAEDRSRPASSVLSAGVPRAGVEDRQPPASEAYRPHAPEPVVQPAPTVYGDPGQQWKPLIDPMKVIGGIARSKLLILATTLLGAGLGVMIALSTPKKYEAIAELIVDPRDLKLTDRDLTQNVIASDATLAIVENQVRVLTSGAVLNKVVDKLHLTSDPEFNGQGKGGFSVMGFIRSLLTRKDADGADEGRLRALTVSNLGKSLSVERGGKTFVITVGATTENGDKSALIANTMTDVFLQTYGEIQSDTAGRATNELTARLDELRKGVEAAERKVEDFRASHDLVEAGGRLVSDDQMTRLNDQLSVTRARTLELNARAASARQASVDSVVGGALPEELTSNTMTELRSQYAALKQQADSAAVKLGPRHPERMALDAQLAGARERIAAELRRISASLQVDLKRSVQLEQDLASRLAQAKVRSGDVNNDLVTLRELEREAGAKRSVYEAYLLRAKETGEQRDINTANMSVISKAYAPLEPTGPSRAIKVLLGMFLGFAAGVGLGGMRGAVESLRETAAERSGRGGDGDRRPRDSEDAPARSLEEARSSAARRRRAARPSTEEPEFRDQPPERDVRRPAAAASTSGAEASRPSPAFEPEGYPPGQVAPGPVPPPAFAPGPFGHPMPPQAAPYGYASHPAQAYGPPGMQPQAVYPQAQWAAPPVAPAWQQQPLPPDAGPAERANTVDEIRASLREFREAVQELAESRARRRYF